MADWLHHLPPAEQRRMRWRRRRLRLAERLLRPTSLVILLVGSYLLLCLGLWLWGGRDIALLALLPLLLTPPLGYLAYWLVWNEFHS